MVAWREILPKVNVHRKKSWKKVGTEKTNLKL